MTSHHSPLQFPPLPWDRSSSAPVRHLGISAARCETHLPCSYSCRPTYCPETKRPLCTSRPSARPVVPARFRQTVQLGTASTFRAYSSGPLAPTDRPARDMNDAPCCVPPLAHTHPGFAPALRLS